MFHCYVHGFPDYDFFFMLDELIDCGKRALQVLSKRCDTIDVSVILSQTLVSARYKLLERCSFKHLIYNSNRTSYHKC